MFLRSLFLTPLRPGVESERLKSMGFLMTCPGFWAGACPPFRIVLKEFFGTEIREDPDPSGV
jgi:hypothetical protein